MKNKKDRIYLKANRIDVKIKGALKQRDLSFETVVTRKTGINCEKAFLISKTELQYKSRLFSKCFVKVPPQYRSKTYSNCVQINKNLKLSDKIFEYICSFTGHLDTNASINTLSLKSFGLGTNLVDLKPDPAPYITPFVDWMP